MENNTFKAFANSFQAVARLRLEGIECLLKHLGDPHKGLKYIHVAGTNGKGSVCSFLESILRCAGFRTGKYTSPNLISVCERIAVDGEMISERDMNTLLKTVKQGVQSVIAELGESPTQFEIWTAAAFLYFKERQCDIVVLETGLGGTRDATNIIKSNLASVITRLDLDHTEYLGDTIETIAAEKAGIIKAYVPLPKKPSMCNRLDTHINSGLCISANQKSGALDVIKRVCAEKNNQLVIACEPISIGYEGFRERFDYISANGTELKNIECVLCGIYQPENASLAIETAIRLGVDEEYIRQGIKNATHPARFEVICKKPVVIYDGAHNKNGVEALCKSLCRYFPDWVGATFVMGFMGDKDMESSFRCLAASGLMQKSQIFGVQVKDNPRAASADEICSCAEACGIDATPFGDIGTAYRTALELGKPIIICGSLYLYKDFSEIKQ